MSTNNLNKLTGVREEVFNIFLQMLPTCKSKVSKENRILTFLIKIKIRMSFDALFVIFKLYLTIIEKNISIIE